MLPRNTIQTEYRFLIAEQIKYSDEVFFLIQLQSGINLDNTR